MIFLFKLKFEILITSFQLQLLSHIFSNHSEQIPVTLLEPSISYYLYMKKLMFQEANMSMFTHMERDRIQHSKQYSGFSYFYFYTPPLVNDNLNKYKGKMEKQCVFLFHRLIFNFIILFIRIQGCLL